MWLLGTLATRPALGGEYTSVCRGGARVHFGVVVDGAFLRGRAWVGSSVMKPFCCVALMMLGGVVGYGAVGWNWYRGNTHTHTLWSDGDAPPERVARWYREQGYQFLVLSDHNILMEGERWFPVKEGSRLTLEKLEALREAEGKGEVETRERAGGLEMRLRTLRELRDEFEEAGRFIFIQGEEISDGYEGAPVHINALNVEELIPPQGGKTMREVIQANLDAIAEQGRRLDRPVLGHVNHPNFGWALTAEDIAAISGENFFEVYNGHSGVRNYGDASHPSTERMWDIALTLRLTRLGNGVLYGLATDDSHEYYEWGVGVTNPGRGWVMVRAGELEAGAIITALRAGEFYASSGVELVDFRVEAGRFEVEIRGEAGVTYTTEFIGTRRVGDGLGEVGEVLDSVEGLKAVHRFKGDEVYVRAKVTSSRLHPNPYAEGDHEAAWVQPVVPR